MNDDPRFARTQLCAAARRQGFTAALLALAATVMAGCAPGDAPADAAQASEAAAAVAAGTSGMPGTAAARTDDTADTGTVDWPAYGGNLGSQRYSPLAQIDASNVASLETVWRFRTANFGPRPESRNETTPLALDGILYTTVGVTRNVVAIDGATGETLWLWRTQDPADRYEKAPRKNSGRGLGYWSDGAGDDRLFVITPGFYLVALDRASGQPVPGFGTDGVVDLMVGVRGEPTETAVIGNSSPPLVVGNTVVVGPAHAPAFRPRSKANFKGDVRGYDARTGALKWTFHTIPEPGEPGYETWLDGSAEYTGNAGVWAPMSGDGERGLVYLPVEGALGDYYGGERPGNNLFGSSLVCLDADTGELKWYFQLVHHDIWDWDTTAAPILLDIVVDGREIPAVAQITKQAWVYTFDRVTGEPVWPIEERVVPQSDVPGERTSPTQPFPTKPAAFDRQGLTAEDLIDFTPELRAEALEAISIFRTGPMFTPPSLGAGPDGKRGSLVLPSAVGGGNWEGGAYDPETHVLYVGSHTNPSVMALQAEPDFSDMRYINGGGAAAPDVRGLPVIKPPWGRITAIDMDAGEHLWRIANGPTPPNIAEHPALRGLDIPETGRATRPVTFVTKTLLFTAEGWGGRPILRAHDKATGALVEEIELPGAVGGLPLSYAVDGRQFIVLSVAGENGAELVALALP